MNDTRDNVIDWLHAVAPNLLCDEDFAEGLIHFVNVLVRRAVAEQQKHDKDILELVLERAVALAIEQNHQRLQRQAEWHQ